MKDSETSRQAMNISSARDCLVHLNFYWVCVRTAWKKQSQPLGL